ncbi:hypothetical protein AHAS_Ahas11G0064300 [Arachis hypogaea]
MSLEFGLQNLCSHREWKPLGERGRCLGLGRPRPSFSESEECRRVSVYAKCDEAAGTMRSLHCHHQASQTSEESIFSDQDPFHLTLVITATICCWMMWAIVYLAQMKPLIVPILNEGE